MSKHDGLIARLEAMFSHRGDGIPTQYVNPDGPEAIAAIRELEAALGAAIGFMLNTKIDLETGCPKATAIRTIEGGIARARLALGREDQSNG